MTQATINKAEMQDAAGKLRGITLTTRDGMALAANLYGCTNSALPIVLERTPYGKDNCDQSERYLGMVQPLTRAQLAEHFNNAGFIYIVQDCRGTGHSEGTFSKYTQEAADTVDTIGWIRSQPWCNGYVGMVGFSYGAACQIPALDIEGLKIESACADCGGFSNAYHSGVRQGGAFALKQATWAYAQALRDKTRAGDDAALQKLHAEHLDTWLHDGPWSKEHSPLQAATTHRDNLAKLWQTGDLTNFWRQDGLYKSADSLRKNDTSILFISSWFDTSLVSTLENFQAKSTGFTAQTSLIVGPWSHGNRFTSVSGETDFGPQAIPENGLGSSMLDLRLDWISADINRRDSGKNSRSSVQVRYFEMGGGTGQRTGENMIDHGGNWQSDRTWPPKATEQQTFYLTKNALLDARENVTPTTRSWISNPERPVPTLGGAINSGEPIMSGGMFDQNTLASRSDVLTFRTEPLVEELRIAGSVSAGLWIACDQPDADITIKLIDEYPNGGPAVNISDGILRLRYRNSWRVPEHLPHNKAVFVSVLANPVANLFQPGHRIRLDIAASNFPNFDVNPQTGAAQGIPGPRLKAKLTLISNRDHASRLIVTKRIADR